MCEGVCTEHEHSQRDYEVGHTAVVVVLRSTQQSQDGCWFLISGHNSWGQIRRS